MAGLGGEWSCSKLVVARPTDADRNGFPGWELYHMNPRKRCS